MSKCCGSPKEVKIDSCDPCSPCSPVCAQSSNGEVGVSESRFRNMVDNCFEYVEANPDRPVVGILCEYTPREIIMAAGAIPVCLCGGSQDTIASAEEDLPSNLCPLIKSTYGYHKEKCNPFLEKASLIVAETTCDGKKKMYELMAKERPMYVLELPQKQNDPDAFDHWVKEIRKLKEKLEEFFGVEITTEKLSAAIETMNTERNLRKKLAGLMKSEDPPITGKRLLFFNSLIAGIPCDTESYRNAYDEILNTERKGSNKDKVRVLLTGVPVVHGAERVVNIIEDNGGLIVAMENCTGLKPLMREVDNSSDDKLKAIAEHYFDLPCSVMTSNEKRFDAIRQLVDEYKPDCIIDLIWHACLTYDVESKLVQRIADQELNIPYLRIGTDFSPSDSARIAVRVEALYETVKMS